MKILLNTCLLFALLPAVASLICYMCLSEKQSCHNPVEIECAEDEDACLNVASDISIGDDSLMSASAKTCVQSKVWQTGNYFLGTEHNISNIAKVEVCQKDLCNKKDIRLPRRSELEENGQTCPACFSMDSDHCESQNTISCRGNETKCLYITATGKAPEDVEYNVAFRGCATPNACTVPKGETDMVGGLITANVTHMKCTEAPMSPPALEGYTKAPHLLWRLPFLRMK